MPSSPWRMAGVAFKVECEHRDGWFLILTKCSVNLIVDKRVWTFCNYVLMRRLSCWEVNQINSLSKIIFSDDKSLLKLLKPTSLLKQPLNSMAKPTTSGTNCSNTMPPISRPICVRNQFQIVCIFSILLYGRFLLKTLKLTFLFHSLLIQGAATAIGAGNKVKDLLNQAARQVKGGRWGFKVSGERIAY